MSAVRRTIMLEEVVHQQEGRDHVRWHKVRSWGGGHISVGLYHVLGTPQNSVPHLNESMGARGRRKGPAKAQMCPLSSALCLGWA